MGEGLRSRGFLSVAAVRGRHRERQLLRKVLASTRGAVNLGTRRGFNSLGAVGRLVLGFFMTSRNVCQVTLERIKSGKKM